MIKVKLLTFKNNRFTRLLVWVLQQQLFLCEQLQAQALYDVTRDEIEAMRRYVAKWSKNSTLIPIKDEDGKFKYIDFSSRNAYDTLTRPIQTVVNAVQAGEQDKDGIMDDFLKGFINQYKRISRTIYIRIYLDRSFV